MQVEEPWTVLIDLGYPPKRTLGPPWDFYACKIPNLNVLKKQQVVRIAVAIQGGLSKHLRL